MRAPPGISWEVNREGEGRSGNSLGLGGRLECDFPDLESQFRRQQPCPLTPLRLIPHHRGVTLRFPHDKYGESCAYDKAGETTAFSGCMNFMTVRMYYDVSSQFEPGLDELERCFWGFPVTVLSNPKPQSVGIGGVRYNLEDSGIDDLWESHQERLSTTVEVYFWEEVEVIQGRR
jgi:hypothetical protein